jgi:hypothetical protein
MLSFDLANKVRQYLGNAIELDELKDWLAGQLPFYLQDPESDDAKLAGVLELGLAEMDDDTATEEDLRRELKRFMADHQTVQASFPSPISWQLTSNVTGSMNKTIAFPRRSLVSTTTTEWTGVWGYPQKVRA